MSDLPTGSVTLVFTDIEGSTRLLQQLGDLYAEILAQHRRLLRTAFAAWEGHEVDTQGDSFLYAFQRAVQAVAAAVEAQRALVAHRWPEGVVVRVRMGLHTGEPLRIPEGYVGIDVHRAARIAAAGYGGQILCSYATAERVRRRLPPGVHLRDLGTHRLKDLNQPEHILQIVAAGLPADFPPLRALDHPSQNLPERQGPLVGRGQELEAAVEMVRRPETALLTLTGPRGVGKTRLALEIAATVGDHFADGVLFVRLGSGADARDATVAIAATLGVEEAPRTSLFRRLREHLHDHHLLLVLDNLEEASGAEETLARLLIMCPHLTAIATANRPLGIRGEQELAVAPLSVADATPAARAATTRPAAVELFLQRARLAKPDFALNEATLSLVAELVARLEGLPLAIELAAARINHLPLRALLARLDRRLALLPPRSRQGAVRPQTLHEAIAWSYHLLRFEEQALFRRLAVFAGSFDATAAEAVCDAAGGLGVDVHDALEVFVEAGLLRRDAVGIERRYRMHEAVRLYALERLHRSGEAPAIFCHHASDLLDRAKTAEPPSGAEAERELSWLDREWHNIESAFAWARSDEAPTGLALSLAASLAPHWQGRGLPSRARTWLEEAVALDQPEEAPARHAEALTSLGVLAGEQGDADDARSHLEQSVALWRTLDEPAGRARALVSLAEAAAQQADLDAARALAEEGAALAREGGDVRTVAEALAVLGHGAFDAGDLSTARGYFREMLALERELEDTRGRAVPLAFLGILALLEGDQAGGRALVEESLALLLEVDDRPTAATALGYLVRLGWRDGDEAALIKRVEEWLSLSRALQDRTGAARALMILGMAAHRRDDDERGEACYEESLLLSRERPEDPLTIAGSLTGLAEIAAARGLTDRAARLYGAAAAALDRLRDRESPADRVDRDRVTALVRAGQRALGREPGWSAGQAMTPRQAATYALE